MKMHLAQAATETNSSPASNPTYLIFTAIIAGVVAITVSYITNRRADSREVEKTRREVLSTAVTNLIEKSETRYTTLAEDAFYNGGTDIDNELENQLLELERAMKLETYRVQIHGSQRLYDLTYALYDIHSASGTSIMKFNLGMTKFMESIDHVKLAQTTALLIDEIRIETKIAKKRQFAEYKRSP